MKRSIITSLFAPLLVTLILAMFNSSAQAHHVEPPLDPSIGIETLSTKERGGTRGLIQLRTSITVTQPENDYLEITAVDQAGIEVHHSTTTALKTQISTESWDSGSYTIITVDAYGDYQNFYIIVE
jgi:hypothetical protein